MMDADAVGAIVDAIVVPEVIDLGDNHKVIALPKGMTIQDLRGNMPPPNRIKQKVTLLTVDAFVAYVNRFAGEATTIFAYETDARYDAAIDFHDPGKRGTLDHTAIYACPPSEQWTNWSKFDGKFFDQVEFALFLESNLKEITSPPGAALLQVAIQLEMHKSAEFQSEVNLENGQVRFRYEETLRSGGKKPGDLEIPKSFNLSLPVFVDGSKHAMEARFRYQMEGGKLSLGYQLIRPKEVWNAAVKLVTAEIRKGVQEKKVHLYAGSRG